MSAIDSARELVEAAWANTKDWESNYRRAQKLLEGASAAEPASIDLLTCLGAVLSDRGMHTKAVEVLQRAVTLGSDDANTYFNLAVAVLNTRQSTRAMRLFKQADTHRASEQTWRAYFDPHGH